MANKGVEKSSDRRAGKRRDRNQRAGTRIPELGYYLIVTDTERKYSGKLGDDGQLDIDLPFTHPNLTLIYHTPNEVMRFSANELCEYEKAE